MQNSVLEWNYHFSNLIMELMPQFIIMLPVLSAVKSGTPVTPSKERSLGLSRLIRQFLYCMLLLVLLKPFKHDFSAFQTTIPMK